MNSKTPTPGAKRKDSTKAGQKAKPRMGPRLVRSVRELLGVLERGESPEKHFTARLVKSIEPPAEYNAQAVRNLRETLGASQPVFAMLLGVSRIQVQSWERGVRTPSLLARRLLDEIAAHPDRWRARFLPAA